MLKKGEMVTLNDGKHYTVVFVTNYNNKNYAYIIDQDDYSNSMFCELENNNLTEVVDTNILEELLKLFVINGNN